MRRKGIFTILAAVFMVLAFSAMAFAANQVFLKTTVPNIPKSTCWQAGTDTMEFDHLSNMAEGDVIEFTLNNNVTVCKAINMFVTLGDTAGVLDTTGDLPVSTTGGAITATGTVGQQWGFLVTAPVGQQIIRLTLRQRITVSGVLASLTPANVMTFTAGPITEKLVVKLFDGKIGNAQSGIWKQASPAVAGVYFTQIVSSDNALCIDTLTLDYQGEYVQNTPNSIPQNVAQKLNFSGDYTIAHIMPAAQLSLVTCKDAQCGHIVLGQTEQGGGTCTSFDYETFGTGGNGYCTDHKAFTGYLPMFIINSTQAFEVAPYTIKAEILVNGNRGEHGVYWSSTPPAYGTSDVTICGTSPGGSGFTGVTYFRGDGTTTVTTPQAPGSNNCAAVSAAEKAVEFRTAAQSLFSAGQFFFNLNLPPFVYNLAEVNAGDLVTIHVTLEKATCGKWEFDLCMGTFGCPTGPGATSSILCPYVTSLAGGGSFWNGIALTNTNESEATVTLTAYKADGTTASATETVPAQGVIAKLVSDLTWTGTTPAEVPAYISATSSTTGLNGFIMMADGANNSMGYLCK